MLNEKPQVNHLPETFSRFSKSTKEAFSSFLSGDIFNYKKVRTKRRFYLPGCFYFYGQIVILMSPTARIICLATSKASMYFWTAEAIEASSAEEFISHESATSIALNSYEATFQNPSMPERSG